MGSPPAQGGIQTLGSGATVDVPVNMHDKFQQSLPISSEGASLYLTVRVLDIPVMPQRQDAQSPLCRRREIPQVQFFWRLLTRPLTSQRQVRPDRPARCVVRQWIHDMRLYLDSWQNFTYFPRESGIQILRSTSCSSPEKCAQSMLQFFTINIVIISMRPLYFAVIPILSGFF